MRSFPAQVIFVAAMLLASCESESSIVCATVPPLEDDIGSLSDFAANMNDPAWLERRAVNCLHRWGYRLAASTDSGLTIAQAVMQACSLAVYEHAEKYAAMAADDYEQRYAPGVVDARERLDYEAQARADRIRYLEREANFRVQQGKSGKCRPPR